MNMITQLTFNCLKLTIKTPERRQWHPSGVFIVNFEHISDIFVVFLLLPLNKPLLPGMYILNYIPKKESNLFWN